MTSGAPRWAAPIAVALDRAIALLRRLSRATKVVAGALLLLLCIATGVEVVIRKLFARSFQGVDELGGYTLAVVSTFAFTYALLERSHIRIDALYGALPARIQRVMDILALVGLIAFFGMITLYAWELFFRSYARGTTSMTPLAIPLAYPQALWFAGFALFVATSMVLLLRSLLALVMGQPDVVARLVGSRSATEEARDEAALARRLGAEER